MSPSDPSAGTNAARPDDVTEVERFRDRLGRALDGDPATVARLGYAGVTACFEAEGDAVTLSARRKDVGITDERDADVELSFAPGALDRFASGQVPLATAIVDGEATARGPVGRLLSVSPMLSGLLRAVAEDDAPEFAGERQSTADEDAEGLWAIEVRGVHKGFGGKPVLTGIDLRLPEGAISVILGPSGTGKSVLIKHIIGLLAPDKGDVVVHGKALSGLSVSELLHLRRRYGVLFQDGALFASMSLYDNVAFPLRQHTDLPEPVIDKIVTERLQDVGLGDFHDSEPGTLSGGQRKRAGFARALVLEPEIVLFDEPDSGLDPVRTSLLSDLILQMHPRYGGTYVVITHDITVAKKLGQHLALVWKGEVVASGSRDEIFNSDDPFVRQFLAGDTEGPLGME